MRISAFFKLWLVSTLVLTFSAQFALAQRKKQVAVLNFDFATVDTGLARQGYGDARNLSKQIAEGLTIRLTQLGSYVMVERERIMKVIGEQDFGAGGRVDPATAAKLRQILGADQLVVGTVTSFDMLGGPKNSSDRNWDPNKVSVYISVNYSLIDTTTGRVIHANSATSDSRPTASPEKKNGFGNLVLKGLEAWGNNGRTSNTPRPTMSQQELRNKIKPAVDQVVTTIAGDLDNVAAGRTTVADANPTPETIISGLIISVDGPSVVIRGLDRAKVRQGDHLYVRRVNEQVDPITNEKIRFTSKIGEVDIVEIQDQVIVGSYSGSTPTAVRDIVTNSAEGKGIPENILNLAAQGSRSASVSSAPVTPPTTTPRTITPRPTPAPSSTGRRRP